MPTYRTSLGRTITTDNIEAAREIALQYEMGKVAGLAEQQVEDMIAAGSRSKYNHYKRQRTAKEFAVWDNLSETEVFRGDFDSCIVEFLKFDSGVIVLAADSRGLRKLNRTEVMQLREATSALNNE